jgi:hypothetical protein
MKTKKKKLPSLSRIRRKLFKLWSEKIRERSGFKCEYCGKDLKDVYKLDSHHFVSRKMLGNPLKFDIRNGVSADPNCHKFSINSFHRNPIRTMKWLMDKDPERYQYLYDHAFDKVDLDNREVLKEIEKCLLEGRNLDINKLKEIEKQFPRIVKTRTPKLVPNGNLFKEESSSESE